MDIGHGSCRYLSTALLLGGALSCILVHKCSEYQSSPINNIVSSPCE